MFDEIEYVDPADSMCEECKCSFGVHLMVCSKFTRPKPVEAATPHDNLEWGTNCLRAPDRGPHECNGNCSGDKHVCLRCGCVCLCSWCNEGNPRTQSSVTDRFVHTDTSVGRVTCMDSPSWPVEAATPVSEKEIWAEWSDGNGGTFHAGRVKPEATTPISGKDK